MDWNVLGPVLGCSGAFVVILIICCCCCCCKKKKKETKEQRLESIYVDDACRAKAPKEPSRPIVLSNAPPQVAFLRQYAEKPAVQQRYTKDYCVSDLFIEKHVSLLSDRPTNKRSFFAEKKAKKAYKQKGFPLPPKYTIIFVRNKNTFCRAIEKEAKNHRAQANSPFTTRERFYVMNFILNCDSGRYNYVFDEGNHRLELSCDSNDEINHLEGIVS